MSLSEIPDEKEQLDLGSLPKTNILRALRWELRKSEQGRTGGLIITFEDKQGRTVPQKYSPMSGTFLKAALTKLGVKELTELRDHWYEYTLVAMRMGYPRYIPKIRAE